MKQLKLLLGVTLFTGVAFSAHAQPRDTICRMIERHEPRADVEYKSGVDVDGNPVAPADLSSNNFELPPVVKIPFTVNLAERFDLDYNEDELNAPLGILEVYPDGRVMQDGRDLTPQAYAYCTQEEIQDGDGQVR